MELQLFRNSKNKIQMRMVCRDKIVSFEKNAIFFLSRKREQVTILLFHVTVLVTPWKKHEEYWMHEFKI